MDQHQWLDLQNQVRRLVKQLLQPTIRRAKQNRASLNSLNKVDQYQDHQINELDLYARRLEKRMEGLDDLAKRVTDNQVGLRTLGNRYTTDREHTQTELQSFSQRLNMQQQSVRVLQKQTDNIRQELSIQGNAIITVKVDLQARLEQFKKEIRTRLITNQKAIQENKALLVKHDRNLNEIMEFNKEIDIVSKRADRVSEICKEEIGRLSQSLKGFKKFSQDSIEKVRKMAIKFDSSAREIQKQLIKIVKEELPVLQFLDTMDVFHQVIEDLKVKKRFADFQLGVYRGWSEQKILKYKNRVLKAKERVMAVIDAQISSSSSQSYSGTEQSESFQEYRNQNSQSEISVIEQEDFRQQEDQAQENLKRKNKQKNVSIKKLEQIQGILGSLGGILEAQTPVNQSLAVDLLKQNNQENRVFKKTNQVSLTVQERKEDQTINFDETKKEQIVSIQTKNVEFRKQSKKIQYQKQGDNNSRTGQKYVQPLQQKIYSQQVIQKPLQIEPASLIEIIKQTSQNLQIQKPLQIKPPSLIEIIKQTSQNLQIQKPLQIEPANLIEIIKQTSQNLQIQKPPQIEPANLIETMKKTSQNLQQKQLQNKNIESSSQTITEIPQKLQTNNNRLQRQMVFLKLQQQKPLQIQKTLEQSKNKPNPFQNPSHTTQQLKKPYVNTSQLLASSSHQKSFRSRTPIRLQSSLAIRKNPLSALTTPIQSPIITPISSPKKTQISPTKTQKLYKLSAVDLFPTHKTSTQIKKRPSSLSPVKPVPLQSSLNRYSSISPTNTVRTNNKYKTFSPKKSSRKTRKHKKRQKSGFSNNSDLSAQLNMLLQTISNLKNQFNTLKNESQSSFQKYDQALLQQNQHLKKYDFVFDQIQNLMESIQQKTKSQLHQNSLDMMGLQQVFQIFKLEFASNNELLSFKFNEFQLKTGHYIDQLKLQLQKALDDCTAIVTQRKRQSSDNAVMNRKLLKKQAKITQKQKQINQNFIRLKSNLESISEFCKISVLLQAQDEIDKDGMALLGLKQKPQMNSRLQQRSSSIGPAISKDLLSLDSKCFSCSGQSSDIMGAFKMACLAYQPSKVLYNSQLVTRKELIRFQQRMLQETSSAALTSPSVTDFRPFTDIGLYSPSPFSVSQTPELPPIIRKQFASKKV